MLVGILHMCEARVVMSLIRHNMNPCIDVTNVHTWYALTRRRVSSTERPTGGSFMVIWRRMPLASMMNRPLQGVRAWRDAWRHTPESVADILEEDPVVQGDLVGEVRHEGNAKILAKATFCARGLCPAVHDKTCTRACHVTYQATWVKTESTEAATTSAPMARKSSRRSLKARISVGHTKVLRGGEPAQRNR